MKTKVPNNQHAIARSLEAFGKKIDFRVTAVGDDGNVCVNVPDSIIGERLAEVSRQWFGNTAIGDGCQQGAIFINHDDNTPQIEI